MAAKTQREAPERRFLQTQIDTVSADEEEAAGSTISGYAATFGKVADLWWFDEVIAPGAFAESARDDDVVFVFNHDVDALLGRTVAGTLRLSEDEKGLRYELDLPDTQLGRDVRELVRRGDLNSMSFSFDTLEEEVDHDRDKPLRTLKRVRLWDVSIVTYPAYDGTSVDLRSAAQARAETWKSERNQAGREAPEAHLRRLQLRARALSL